MAEINRKMNQDLLKIYSWSQQNLLSVNPTKTNAMLISKLKVSPRPPLLFLNGELVHFVDRVKNLGIIFKNNLEWDLQINAQCGKIYGTLKKLNLTTRHFDIQTKVKLFKSLVLPHFIYGDFLYTNASVGSLDKLRVALNACIRYVFNLTRYHRVSHLHKTLIGCPFSSFYKYRSCVTLFRIITTGKPNYLFANIRPFRNSRTRSYLIPQHSSAYYSQTFFARGVANWNSIPTSIKCSTSKFSFKRDLLFKLNSVN